MSAKVIIHSCGTGLCALSGKEGEGMTVTFEDGTLREGFLSHRAFQQLIKMKVAPQGGTKPAVPQAAPVAAIPANGPAK
jgi:hypothetical protein